MICLDFSALALRPCTVWCCSRLRVGRPSEDAQCFGSSPASACSRASVFGDTCCLLKTFGVAYPMIEADC